jgi:5-methylcytosine-specific restriction endonuclease McrA
MSQLKEFIDGSETFGSFVFCGNYDMPNDIFFKLYEHFQKTDENHLDAYSHLISLYWEIQSGDDFSHSFIECEQYEKYVSISRKLKLFNPDINSEIRQYIRKCWFAYRDYLYWKSNEPRRKACKFTSLKEVKDYIYLKYGKKCLCCGSENKLSLDHVIPIQKGGKDEIENLQPLCKSCNSSKGIKVIDYRK